MFEFVNKILSGFRSCFSRQAAFAWFVVIVTGFLIRPDSLGVTSVIRDLALNPALYGSMLHFFRADSWDWLGEEHVSHVVQMFRDGCRAARYFGRSLFVLDRYFLTVPLLPEWSAYEKEHPGILSIVTRAKKNCTAYEQPEPYKGRGTQTCPRPRCSSAGAF